MDNLCKSGACRNADVRHSGVGALMDQLRFYLEQAKLCADTARVSQQADHRMALENECAAWLSLADGLRSRRAPSKRLVLRRA